MARDFNRGLSEAAELADAGCAWEALARLQAEGIEELLLNLTADDMRANPRSEREAAVGHALAKLCEYWIDGGRVVSILGWLKVTACRHAKDARRHREAPDVSIEGSEATPDGENELDPIADRKRAVAIARSVLPELGLPSVTDTMTVFLDRIAAGDDATPGAIAAFLDLPYSTVTTHMSRGLKRLEERVRGRDFDLLFIDDDHDDIEEM